MTRARSITLFAVVNLAALAVHAALSWIEAGAATYEARPVGHLTFFATLGAWVSAWFPAGDIREWLRVAVGGQGVPAEWFVPLYTAPLIVATAANVATLVILARSPEGDDHGLPSRLLKWSVAFACVMAFALPVLVGDFWLSVAWGKTLWAGGNPYYDVPAAAVDGLPFDSPILKMTYGPLWAMVSWAIAAMTGGHVLASAVLFKAVLLASWIGVLVLIRQLVADQPARYQSIALVTIGWLPVGSVHVAGDGHNDGVMMLGVLLWLWLGSRGHHRLATTALAASAVVKYVTAPLLALDLLWVMSAASGSSLWHKVKAYAPHAAIVVVLWGVVFAPVVESTTFFAETLAVNAGGFFRPADAVIAAGHLVGIEARPLAILVSLAFPAAAALAAWRFMLSPTPTTRYRAVAAMMLPVLFILAGHVWPWYVLWLAVPAVLTGANTMQRWSTGVLLTAPFTLPFWTARPFGSDWWKFEGPALLAYGGALAWMIGARWWMEPPGPERSTVTVEGRS